MQRQEEAEEEWLAQQWPLDDPFEPPPLAPGLRVVTHPQKMVAPLQKHCLQSVLVCQSACLGLGWAGHTHEHTHDINNAVSLGLHNRRRERSNPYGQSHTRCQLVSVSKNLKSTRSRAENGATPKL